MIEESKESLEASLRRARRDAFSSDPAEAEAASEEIERCLKALVPHRLAEASALRARERERDPRMANYREYQRGLPGWAQGPL